ncbi:hypothetical protein BGZ47_002471 [Haplosporangium gracile]|nr:hypothetical protein BGZ47_002471 [Haplosporangium gracile]
MSTTSHARLLTVNGAVYDVFTPLLYHTLDQRQTERILSAPTTAFAGLFNNAQHVRSISMSGEFCVRLVNGFITHSNNSNNSSTSAALSMPEWVGLLGPFGNDVQNSVPLLPFPYLTSLTCKTKLDSYPAPSRALMENYNNGIFLAQIAVVIRFSPHLARLDLDDIRINNEQDLDFFSAIIARSTNLETIKLVLSTPDKELQDKIIPKIFFYCPSCLKTLDISLRKLREATASTSSSIFAEMKGTPARRQDPLLQLTTLKIWYDYGFEGDILCSIFDHCTQITTLDVPYIRQHQDVGRVGQHIATTCTRLKELTASLEGHFGSIYAYDRLEWTEQLGAVIMNAMPQDQLLSISFSGRELVGGELNSALLRHSSSLTTIKFHECRYFDEEDIRTILQRCSALEVFEITAITARNIVIGARDLATCVWGSNAIRRLQLVVSFGSISEMKAMRRSAEDPSESVITEKQKNGNTALGLLYRKIRTLVELEYVELDVYLHDDGPNPKWPVFSGPGYLMGGEVKTGAPFKFVRVNWEEWCRSAYSL